MTVLADTAIQALSESEINATLVGLLAQTGLTLLRRDQPLPYTFDLFHDVKEWHEVDSILSGEPHCSGLGSNELRAFAQEHGYLLDHPASCSFTKDWAAAGKVLSKLYEGNRLCLAAEADGVRATCVDARSYYHAFKDVNPLAAAMRCAIAVHQVGSR